MEIRIRTIGDFIRERYAVLVFCRCCPNEEALDLVKLGEVKGLDYDLYDGAWSKLKCSACGEKNPQVIIEPPDRGVNTR